MVTKVDSNFVYKIDNNVDNEHDTYTQTYGKTSRKFVHKGSGVASLPWDYSLSKQHGTD